MSDKTGNIPIPTIKFDSKVTEVNKRLTAAFKNFKLINKTYGIAPDEDFKFDQKSFDEFTRKLCEEHYGKIYGKKGIAKTIRDNFKGDFLSAIITALEKSKSSERLKLLVTELRKIT